MHGVWWTALGLLALSTAHSKIAGTLWGLGFIFAAWLRFGTRSATAQTMNDPVSYAAVAWLRTCVLVAVLWAGYTAFFGEFFKPQSSELNAGLRLVIGAIAVLWLLPHIRSDSSGRIYRSTQIALVLACTVALGFAVSLPRDSYPTNVIPWSAGVAFVTILLAGSGLREAASPRERWIGIVGVLIGITAILASRTRGTYPALIWPIAALIIVAAGSIKQRYGRRALLAGGLLVCGVIAATLALFTDTLRLRETITDTRLASQNGDFNTSTGARIYLFKLGWDTFLESPWVGVGATERKRRIHSAGLGEGAAVEQATRHVRDLGHVHNAYLHHAMDGGLIGLTGFLLTIAGLIVMARHLRNAHPSSAFQLYGMAFAHSVTNLTSVNFAHNYYALMLAISVGLVLVQARLLTTRDRSK